jgi:hypothetical protein
VVERKSRSMLMDIEILMDMAEWRAGLGEGA